MKKIVVSLCLLLSIVGCSKSNDKKLSPSNESVEAGIENLVFFEDIKGSMTSESLDLANISSSTIQLSLEVGEIGKQVISLKNTQRRGNINMSINSSSELPYLNLENKCPEELGRRMTCYLELTLDTKESGLAVDDIVSYNLDINGNQYTFEFTIIPSTKVTEEEKAENLIVVTANDLDYGTLEINEEEKKIKTIQLKNTSRKDTLPLDIDFSSLSDITYTTTCGTTLRRRGACFIVLELDSSNKEEKSVSEDILILGSTYTLLGNLNLLDQSEIESEILAKLSISPENSIDLGTLNNEETKNAILTISNNSREDLDLTIESSSLVKFSIDSCPNVLNRRTSCFLNISIDGSVAGVGTHQESITISGQTYNINAIVEEKVVLEDPELIVEGNLIDNEGIWLLSLDNESSQDFLVVKNDSSSSKEFPYDFGTLPEGLTVDDNCNGSVARYRQCQIKFSYSGTFLLNHDIELNNTTYRIHKAGTIPEPVGSLFVNDKGVSLFDDSSNTINFKSYDGEKTRQIENVAEVYDESPKSISYAKNFGVDNIIYKSTDNSIVDFNLYNGNNRLLSEAVENKTLVEYLVTSPNTTGAVFDDGSTTIYSHPSDYNTNVKLNGTYNGLAGYTSYYPIVSIFDDGNGASGISIPFVQNQDTAFRCNGNVYGASDLASSGLYSHSCFDSGVTSVKQHSYGLVGVKNGSVFTISYLNSRQTDPKDSVNGVDCNRDGTRGDASCIYSGVKEIYAQTNSSGVLVLKEDGSLYSFGGGATSLAIFDHPSYGVKCSAAGAIGSDLSCIESGSGIDKILLNDGLGWIALDSSGNLVAVGGRQDYYGRDFSSLSAFLSSHDFVDFKEGYNSTFAFTSDGSLYTLGQHNNTFEFAGSEIKSYQFEDRFAGTMYVLKNDGTMASSGSLSALSEYFSDVNNDIRSFKSNTGYLTIERNDGSIFIAHQNSIDYNYFSLNKNGEDPSFLLEYDVYTRLPFPGIRPPAWNGGNELYLVANQSFSSCSDTSNIILTNNLVDGVNSGTVSVNKSLLTAGIDKYDYALCTGHEGSLSNSQIGSIQKISLKDFISLSNSYGSTYVFDPSLIDITGSTTIFEFGGNEFYVDMRVRESGGFIYNSQSCMESGGIVEYYGSPEPENFDRCVYRLDDVYEALDVGTYNWLIENQ